MGATQGQTMHEPAEFVGPLAIVGAFVLALGRGRVARLVADLAEVSAGDRVLDVGAGPGVFVREAARRGADAVAVDPSAPVRRVARWLTPASLRGRIAVLDGVAESLPVADGAVTLAWAVSSVHHWEDVDRGLAELRRVLAPGGRIVLVERRARRRPRWAAAHAFTPAAAEDVAARAASAGFGDVRVQQLGNGRGALLAILAVAPAQ